MSARRRISLSPAAGSKRSREPETMEEAWRLHCKYSVARSRRAAWKYGHSRYMSPSLRDFAVGGRYYEDDPPLKPMSGGDFEKWRSGWERERAWEAADRLRRGDPAESGEGSSSGGARATAEEEEDPLFLEAVALSKKEAADKAQAEAEEQAQAIAAVEALKAWEAGGVVILGD